MNHFHYFHNFWIFKIAIFDGSFDDMADLEDFYNIILAILCVTSAALASGLTMGLMSFDNLKLEIKSMTGNEKEIKAASSILPLIKEHHLLLVTLLLYNSLAMEALPIFLGALVPNWVAVLMSITLVLLFGEVSVQSISHYFV
jgi:metal transporter CNNM